MNVAALQWDLAWEDPEANFRRATELGDLAVDRGADLIVLPEMFATGFSMDAERVASFAPGVLDFLVQRSRAWGRSVVAGVAEPAQPKPHNVCVVLDAEGETLARYVKIHPFSLAQEDRHFAAGSELVGCAVRGVRVTPLICYDLRFPELFRRAAEDTDLFVVVANWPEARSDHWRTLLRARAIENLCYVLGVNRVGDGDGLRYRGDSALVDPWGRVIVTEAEEAKVLLGEVRPEQVARARDELGFLRDRRDELYPRLIRRDAGRPQS